MSRTAPAGTRSRVGSGKVLGTACVALAVALTGRPSPTAAQPLSELARQLLPDVSAQELESLEGQQPLELEDPLVGRILDRCRRTALSVFLLAGSDVWTGTGASPPRAGELYRVQGRCAACRPWQPSDLQSEGDLPQGSWLVQMETDSGESLALIAAEVPTGLGDSQPLDPDNRRVSAVGFFLPALAIDEEVKPAIVVRRVAWHPTTVEGEITPGMAALGRHGVDLGLVEQAAHRVGANLDHNDTLVVAQMLTAAGAGAVPAAAQPLELVDLLENAAQRWGTFYRVAGVVRRITPIELSEHAYAKRTGITRYYQLDLAIPVGNQGINVRSNDRQAALEYRKEYPTTVLVRELPEGLRAGSNPGAALSVDAWFLRLWSFTSPKSRSIDPTARHLAPLLIGVRPQLVEADSAAFARWIGWLVGGTAAALLALIWWAWSSGRKADRPLRHPPASIEWPP